jgi:hypothetical protein
MFIFEKINIKSNLLFEHRVDHNHVSLQEHIDHDIFFQHPFLLI